jgi:hypothetical protein
MLDPRRIETGVFQDRAASCVRALLGGANVPL